MLPGTQFLENSNHRAPVVPALLFRRNTTLGTRVVEGCTLRAAISGARLAETFRKSSVTFHIGARL